MSKTLDDDGYRLYEVNLSHLELLGVMMALSSEEAREGLSTPQLYAKRKISEATSQALNDLRAERAADGH